MTGVPSINKPCDAHEEDDGEGEEEEDEDKCELEPVASFAKAHAAFQTVKLFF
jgi:hypothetical protein